MKRTRTLAQATLLVVGLSIALTSVCSANATNIPTETAFCGDIEGQLSRLTSFLEGSSAFSRDLNGEWQLLPGKKFVFAGDILDRGAGGLAALRLLNRLKSEYPDRVFYTFGNRDLIKLILVSELSDDAMKTSNPGFEEALVQAGLNTHLSRNDKILKMQWVLSEFGAAKLFDDRRTELLNEGKPASDQDVYNSVLHGVDFHQYLSHAQISYLDSDTGTLFVHGAANSANTSHVPGAPNVKFKEISKWVDVINRWARGLVTQGLSQKSDVKNAAQGLIDMLDYETDTPSVIVARYFDDIGRPFMPSADFIKKLKKQGVHRIAVGHTPTGEIPLVLKADGFEIVMADQSFNSSKTSGSISITDKGVKMKSELPGHGMVEVDTEHGIPEHVGTILSTGELVAGQLASGEIVLFQKDAKFRPIYRTVDKSEIKRLLKTAKPGLCKEVFKLT